VARAKRQAGVSVKLFECGGRHAAARLFDATILCKNFGIDRSSMIGWDGETGRQSEN
jgi:hypothetical protein